MALWLVRAGQHGQHEQRFLGDSRIYLTWGECNLDLNAYSDKSELREALVSLYPGFSKAKISNALGQIWAFGHRIGIGDWIVLPSKQKPAVHFAKVMGPYAYDKDADPPYFHSRPVEWFATDIPRSNFDQDLLYSFGAFMTVCKIYRNEAESRIKAMAAAKWKSISPCSVAVTDGEDALESLESSDLEQVSRDQIAKFISARFKGHGMARLVNAILQAQGYTTMMSSKGPDKGIDILAAPGLLGFGQPRICVQVKSGDSPMDRPTLDQLIGVMQNVHADQGLLVSWSGFKSSVDKERANQFFRVRLWDQNDLINQLLAHYQQLDDDLRAELPLKRIWTIAEADKE